MVYYRSSFGVCVCVFCHTYVPMHAQIDKNIDRQTDRYIDGWMDGWMDR